MQFMASSREKTMMQSPRESETRPCHQQERITLPLRNNSLLPDPGRDKINPRPPSYHASKTTHLDWVQLDKPNHNLDRLCIFLHRHRHFLNNILAYLLSS